MKSFEGNRTRRQRPTAKRLRDQWEARPGLIPDALRSFEDGQRALHQDITDRSPEELWAEAHLVERRLADLVFRRLDGGAVYLPSGSTVTERAWLRERLGRLRAALRRARGAA